jgi:dTDP-4-amino-4,6-dideoxygalactose transaminase
MHSEILFNKAPIVGHDLLYAEEVVLSGNTHGDGKICREVENVLSREYPSAADVLLTSSCTHALELIATLLDLRNDDEVIVPSYTFCSSAGAFLGKGCKIVFADIEVPSMNIDPFRLEALITKNTRALLIVHYAGLACDMDAIIAIIEKYNLVLIEDNAHGFLGSYKGKPLGSFGDFSTLSFHGTKNLSCGEGGALVVNNGHYTDRARVVREKGTNRHDFRLGKISKYEWVDYGSSYVLSDISAAILKRQLEFSSEIQSRRQNIWNQFSREIYPWAEEFDVLLSPDAAFPSSHAFHAFYLIFSQPLLATNFIKHMARSNISVHSHYTPLHLSPFIKAKTNSGEAEFDNCYNASEYSERLVRLPLYYGLEDTQVKRIINRVKEFRCEAML